MKSLRLWVPVFVIAALAAFLVVPPAAYRIAYAVSSAQNRATRDNIVQLSKEDRMSPLFAEIAKAVEPAVVEIRVTKKITIRQGDMEEFFRRFSGDPGPSRTPSLPKAPPQGPQYFARGLGSGVIVDAANGYVVTNHHVVAGADQVQVVLADGRKLKAAWIRNDPQTDIAVLKVEDKNLVDIPLGDSDQMVPGALVLAFGSPEGLQQTVTGGIVSALGRSTGRGNAYQSFIQTDAAINQGNSGGPLVNMRGEVIGINTAIVSQTGGNEGIGFAIPSNMVKSVMNQLVAHGKVVRGYLGTNIQNVSEQLAKSFALPTTKGALVAGVMNGSPAAKAGLKEGDFIVSINGKAIGDATELRNLVANLPPGKAATVEFYRNGKKQVVKVDMEAQPAAMQGGEPAEAPAEETASAKYGLKVAPLTPELATQLGYAKAPAGVVITEVTPGSPADNEGLAKGMVITSVQDQAVATGEQFEKAVSAKAAANGVRIRVTDPSGGTRFVFLSPQK